MNTFEEDVDLRYRDLQRQVASLESTRDLMLVRLNLLEDAAERPSFWYSPVSWASVTKDLVFYLALIAICAILFLK
jgi:hypothetical protein